MPRIIVTTGPVSSPVSDAPVLLDEHVHAVHLSDDHAAAQLIERLAWAITDAEDAEERHPEDRAHRSVRPAARPRRGTPRTRALARG
jgi:hypothetical protein